MSQHRHLAVVAGAATVLAATALASVYEPRSLSFVVASPNWFLYVAFGVAAVVGAAIGARALHVPQWAQPIVAVGGLTLYVSMVFGEGHEILGVIPTPGTVADIRDQIAVAFTEITEMSVPVPVHRGLLLLAVLGVGLIAVLVDFLVATAHRPSLAGLPLLILYAVPVSIDRDGLQWWMFALGAVGYMWLLVTDQLTQVRRWGRPFRAQSHNDLLATTSLGTTGRWIGGFGIFVAALLPVLAPISAGGWLGFGADGSLGSGGHSVSAINPLTQLKGRLVQKQEVELLRLRTKDDKHFYLRVTTLDRFTKEGWGQRELSAPSSSQLSRGIKDDPIPAGVPTLAQETSVEIERFDGSPHLPLFANPTSVSARGDWRWDARYDTAFSTRTTTRDLNYSFKSERVLYNSTQLSKAPASSSQSSVVKEYTPVGRVEPAAKTLVDKLVAGKKTPFEKVLAINDHFSPENGFVYDTQTRAGTTGSDLLDFLENKRGYCEQYASAMAYLVRAAGIPARVAIGFTRGREIGGYTSITNHDAHAWVEVNFEGVGWVPFDPTPAGGQTGRGGLDWARAPTETTPAPGGQTGPSAAPAPSAGEPNGGNATDRPDKDQGIAKGEATKELHVPWGVSVVSPPIAFGLDGRTFPQISPWTLWGGGAGIIALLLLAVPGFWRWETRRIRMTNAHLQRPMPGTFGSNPVVASHSAWDELIDTLIDLGISVDDADTPRAVARTLTDQSHLDDETAAAVRLLASAEEEVRYAPRVMLHRAVASRSDLSAAVGAVRRSLWLSAPRQVRIRAAVLPPSLLARVNRVLQGWAEDAANAWNTLHVFIVNRLPRAAASGSDD